jgi:hypothetical protein
MFVYVTAGPVDIVARCRFFSRTRVDKLCAACAILAGRDVALDRAGVMAPSVVAPVGGKGVVAPELFCVARTEASFL